MAHNVRAEPGAHSQFRAARLQDLRLLLVEDQQLMQRMMQDLLEAEGASVQVANDGAMALLAIAAAGASFDAVLMDVQLPVLDGHSATRVIRKQMGLAHLPVIALSANASFSERQDCLDAGMNDHVGKPFELDHLVAVLRRHCGRSTAAQERLESTYIEASALQRLGGNTPVVSELLKAFLDEIASMPDRLHALLHSGELAAAFEMLHALKGVSATVGARHMVRFVQQAEFRLKNDGGANPHEALSADFRSAVQLTQQGIGEIIAASAR